MKFYQTYKKSNDEDLMQKIIASNNQDALGKLYTQYIPLVYGLCLKYLRHQENAEESVMLIFEVVSKKLRTHDIANFNTWLYGIAKDYCLQILRNSPSPYFQDINELIAESDSASQLANQVDAFEQEAQEGLDIGEGRHDATIARLSEKVKERVSDKKRNRAVFIISLVAALAILITAGNYFWKNTDKQDVDIAQATRNKQDTSTKKETISVEQTLPIEETLTEKEVNEQIAKNEALEKAEAKKLLKEQEKLKAKKAEETISIAAKETIANPTQVDASKKDIKNNLANKNSNALQEKLSAVAVNSARADAKIKSDTSPKLNTAVEPLYLVDGKVVKSISGIPADDIKTMKVLKDKSDTQAYGTRGDNGVIVITTKSGSAKSFGEKEFKAFFYKNAKKYICGNDLATVKVKFEIDAFYKPSIIDVSKSSCKEAKDEVIRIIRKSPKWSKANKTVKLKLEW